MRASCDYDGDSNASGRVVTTVPTFSSFFLLSFDAIVSSQCYRLRPSF